ncbi:MAG: hypothetical protein KC423_18360, partial [Anaerolineales bacterium]|nr:hypothetical protein [Anaerolineales bacterium]
YVAEIGFSRLHVFSYSQRPGTAAAAMPDHVAGPVKKERARRMIALGEQLSQAFHGQFVGEVVDVLWETAVGADTHALRWVGYTDNYIRVHGHGPAHLFNQITPTRLSDPRPDGMSGTIMLVENYV